MAKYFTYFPSLNYGAYGVMKLSIGRKGELEGFDE